MAERSGPGLISEVERVRIDSLLPHPENPRHGDIGAISESLTLHNQYRPIVVQASTRFVLAGNHTMMAAEEIGWEAIDAVVLDVNDEEARRIMVADNRLNALGYDDPARLTALLEDLAITSEGLAGTGFDGDDLDALIAEQRATVDGLGDSTVSDPRSLAPDGLATCPECGYRFTSTKVATTSPIG